MIIGILAAIAIPKFQATKGKANFAGMRSDLHNLVTAEEGYFYDHSAYTAAHRFTAVQNDEGRFHRDRPSDADRLGRYRDEPAFVSSLLCAVHGECYARCRRQPFPESSPASSRDAT